MLIGLFSLKSFPLISRWSPFKVFVDGGGGGKYSIKFIFFFFKVLRFGFLFFVFNVEIAMPSN